jgi:hypothetical protein
MDERSEVLARLTRIETKLDAALKVQGDHETRIRRNEYSLWTGAGVIAAASAFLYKFGLTLH